MNSNYLTEDDFEYQSDNSVLEEKADDIVSFTSSVLLDLSDEDLAVVKDIEAIFDSLKNSLFANSDTILNCKQLGFTDEDKAKFNDVQAVLLAKWVEFGFTEGFFHRYYQTQRQLTNADLTDLQRERINLLLQIINEQKTLVITFNVMGSKDSPVLLDVANYM